MGFLSKLLTMGEGKQLKRYQAKVDKINALEPEFQALSDEELAAKTQEFRERYAAGESLDDLLPEAFAAVREASVRTIGLRHFDVQLIGGMAPQRGADRRDEDRRGQDARLHSGRLSERAFPGTTCISSPSTTTWPGATASGWARSTASWA